MANGSISYLLAQEGGEGRGATGYPSDSCEYFSTVPYRGPEAMAKRDERKCVGNDNTCKAWKSGGTDFCVGHLKGQEADNAS